MTIALKYSQITVNDVDEALGFYRDALGLDVLNDVASGGFRWVTLGSLLVFVLAATMLHTLGYVAPSIHAICPYGGLESMLSLVAVGTFLKRIVIGTFVLFGSTMLLSLAMRRSFCGQICALGALQEFFGKIGQKLFRKRLTVPKKLDGILRYLKFVV
ncbi:MAG TPA: 4Fe-4S binding protein, partial [Rhodoglobus sp.]|nr:4Fe-4S binding protein [Rhodoglobus sp.]